MRSAKVTKKSTYFALPCISKNQRIIGSLFRNISLAVVLNLVIKTAWILANNVVQDRVDHVAFGLYLALYSLGFLFLAIADMGIVQYTTVTLATKPEMLRKLFPSLLGLKITLSIIYPFFMLAAGFILGYRGMELQTLFILCIVQGVLQINAFFRSNFQAFQQFRIDAFASILDRLVMLGIVVVLLLTHITLQSYVWAYLASAVVAMVVLYAATARIHGLMKPKWERGEFRHLLRASLPFAVITVLYSINDKVDQVMLERIIGGDEGKHETGLYGGAYRWVDTAMMYLWTVLPIFFAKFAHHRNDPKQLAKLMAFGQPLAALPMIFASVFVFFHAKKLLFLFSHSSPSELETMEQTMRILFIAALVNGIFAIYSTLLTSTGHERFVSRMIGVSIVLNITLNSIFIPQYGAYSCAWATVASFSFLSLSYLWYLKYRKRIRIRVDLIGGLMAVGALCAAAMWGFGELGLPWHISSVLAGVLMMAAAFAFKLVKIKGNDA